MSKILNQVITKVKENKVAVGVTAATALALGAFYFFFKKPSTETPTQNDQNDQTAGNTNQNDSAYIKKAKQIASNITVQTLGDSKNYSMDTISQVLEQSIELAEDEYVEVTLKNRSERRAFMDSDAAAYERLVLEYNDEVENVLKKAQQTILEILNIQFEDFEESVIVFMEKGHYQEIYMFQAAIRQKIKEKIAATKDLTIEQTKEIIKFQIEILKQQPELLKQVIQKLSTSPETVQLIPIIISNLLNDYIFKEFQVEEEDQMKIMTKPDLASDHEILLLLQEIEQAMFTLMMPYGAGGEGGY